MDAKIIMESMGRCGLVCALCREMTAGKCQGCRNTGATKDCSIYNCEHQNDAGEATGAAPGHSEIKGCWGCAKFPCEVGMFKSVRTRAFVRCAKEEGLSQLARYLDDNYRAGVVYHRADQTAGDYDQLSCEEEILQLLRTGNRQES